jgi:hypothetical protein
VGDGRGAGHLDDVKALLLRDLDEDVLVEVARVVDLDLEDDDIDIRGELVLRADALHLRRSGTAARVDAARGRGSREP